MDIRMAQVDIKLYAADARLLASRDMDVPAVKIEFFQFVFERLSVKAQVDHRAEKHVATDAAEDVEVKRFHKHQIQSFTPWKKSEHPAPAAVPRDITIGNLTR